MLTKEEIEKVASLSRINLSKEAQEKLAAELSRVVDYFKEMQSLDTTDVDLNLAETEITNQMREDAPHDSEIQEAILENAPAREERFFKVKSVL